jgi:hypothetical protein
MKNTVSFLLAEGLKSEISLAKSTGFLYSIGCDIERRPGIKHLAFRSIEAIK